MQIDVKTLSIEPIRQTYDHLARRFGDKPASRYQEASYDIQAAENLHYKPTWDPEQELYDASITKIVMKDWYELKDPRKFYYSPYVLNRSRQQETVETNFKFVESRDLLSGLPQNVVDIVMQVILPLRHAAWGASQNNTFVCGYGYGVTFTQPFIFAAMDNLAIAQYLSRIGLMIGDAEALSDAKTRWLEDPAWQPLRRYIEDTLVTRDPFELFIAQNIALDGLLYPIIFKDIIDEQLPDEGGSAISMLTQFMTDWYDENLKWTNAFIKVVANESEQNKTILTDWIEQWSGRASEALKAIVTPIFDSAGETLVDDYLAELKTRMAKNGLEF